MCSKRQLNQKLNDGLMLLDHELSYKDFKEH